MRNITHNTISILLVISIIFFFSNSKPFDDEIYYKRKIIEFIKTEDSRKIENILTYYQFPISNYWNEKNVSQERIKEIYFNSWVKKEFSKNNIQNIVLINDYQYKLFTKYDYGNSPKSKSIKSVLSEIEFTFNKEGKFSSITNIKTKKVKKGDIFKDNFLKEFNDKSNFLSKKIILVKISLIILLMVNFILQVLLFLKKI